METSNRRKQVEEALQRRLQKEHIIPSVEAVIERLSGPKPLRIYYGIDPTGPDVHLGHLVSLLFLRDLLELGHEPVLLIGDFTARIGDPTDKDAARSALTEAEIKQNMKTYIEQVEKVLPRNSFQVVYNSTWLSKLTLNDLLGLTNMVTVQQMLARDMFQKRIQNEQPIVLSEFLYPLLQGYDSVELKTDAEVGGSDQLFNMKVGRDLERELLNKEKLILPVRLLVDATTNKKMSKSEGNLIAINDEPQEIRRKILAIDDLMIRTVFELCTTASYGTIDTWQQEGKAPSEPRAAKEALADELVRMLHGEEAITASRAAKEGPAGSSLDKFLKESGITNSASEAKRLIEQGGVTVNGEVVKQWAHEVKAGDEVRAGKGHFIKAV